MLIVDEHEGPGHEFCPPPSSFVHYVTLFRRSRVYDRVWICAAFRRSWSCHGHELDEHIAVERKTT